jgi:hypothetical protein
MFTHRISSLTAGAATLMALFVLAPVGARAVPNPTAAEKDADFALSQREASLSDHLSASRGNRSIGAGEYVRIKDVLEIIQSDEGRMRDGQGGELTGVETLGLQARLDVAADDIHWWRHTEVRPPW